MAVLPRGTRVLKMVALVCSEGEGFGPLISKGHPSDTQAGPVEGSVVSVDLNWMRGDSEFLKHNLSTHTKVPMLEILFAGGGEGSLFFLINYLLGFQQRTVCNTPRRTQVSLNLVTATSVLGVASVM